MNALFVARFTLKEIVRRRIFLAVVLLTIALLVLFAILFNTLIDTAVGNGSPNSQPPEMIMLGTSVIISLLAVWSVYLQSSVMTILLTAGMISAEVEAGTFAIIVPKPLRRAEIILGKWLAYALVQGAYTAFLFLSFLGVIYIKGHYWPEEFLSALGLLELATLVLLSLMTLGSTLWPTLVNGAIAILLFIGAPIASIAQFLLPTQSAALQNITTVVSLIIPTDALWHGAAAHLLPTYVTDLLQQAGVGFNAANLPVIGTAALSPVLLIWIVVYIISLPILAIWRFQRRDL